MRGARTCPPGGDAGAAPPLRHCSGTVDVFSHLGAHGDARNASASGCQPQPLPWRRSWLVRAARRRASPRRAEGVRRGARQGLHPAYPRSPESPCGRLAPGRYPRRSAVETPPLERSGPAARGKAPLPSGCRSGAFTACRTGTRRTATLHASKPGHGGGGGPGSTRREQGARTPSVWPILPDSGLKSQARLSKMSYRAGVSLEGIRRMTEEKQEAGSRSGTGLPRCCPAVLVGDTGFEPVTSSVSRKRATAAPIARGWCCLELSRWVRDLNPCTRICSPLPRLSANPPRRPNAGRDLSERTTRLELATSTLARLRSTN